ncbi:TonB-dependent receptor plug domain-containing protein [Aeoliella mucimassa]|uniref:TonB-dependent receptor plug domain-containing protein n=1 Tax=Aeoliella mucimassa TaxID=2527972 RepID=UPI0018D3325C|nr:TonB-dependent receptor [Aeoliella mucimassa]
MAQDDLAPTQEPTLPEVQVQPPVDDAASSEAAESHQATAPLAEPFSANNPPNTLLGTERSYPNLSQLEFGQPGLFNENTGILRGGGNLFDSSAAGTIVTREILAEKQATDMFHALQNEVGVMMQRTAAGQSSPFIRGLTGQQVLILVDGVRLNNSVTRFGPNQYFNTIDPGMVDHLEVVRGAGSVLWGADAIGGVINVVSRSPDSQYGMCCGDYSTGEFHQYYNTADSSSYSRMNVEGWGGSMGVFAGGSYYNVNDLDTGFDFGRQPGTDYDQYAGDVKMNYLLDRNSMLTVSLQHFEQERLPRSDRFPGYPGDLNNSNTLSGARFFDPQQRDLAYVRYQAVNPNAWSDALTVTTSYHRQRDVQTRGVPTTRYQETDVESVGINAVSTKELAEGFGKLTAGFDWYHDDVDSPYGGAATGPIVPDDAFYERFGVFLNWGFALTDRLDVETGVRYELADLAGTPVVEVAGTPTPMFINPNFQDWVAHVGLVYEVDRDIHLVGNISEGFRPPNLDDLMANNPNVLQAGFDLPSLDLTPEHSVTYEIGMKTDHEKLRTQTFVYWTQIDDNIVPITAGANQFTKDNQDSSIQGVEFDGEYLLDRQWSLYGNYWYTYGENKETGAPLSRIPPQQGILGLRWRDRELRSYVTTYVWMADKQDRLDPVRDLSDERIPPGGTPGYATLNVRMGRSYGRHNQHRLSLSLENLTDKDYLVHGSGVYGTGFTARFGYSWVR